MKRTFTCIVCPNGCEITADYEEREGAVEVIAVNGNLCPKGKEYVAQELTDPRRTIASSVRVESGEFPLVSVRLTSPIPKNRIFDAMEEIKKCSVKAPVVSGTVLIHDILGLGSDVVITKDVGRAS
ncbi:molybdopterin oxidoreductase [Oribacterium sp. C9]|uniref:DUF1667 domain-containing protein n=1 Tax=Oribacterium sp. C9 TaxID=1943579 RepID=UPI00098EA6CB|nr:DUF1667 domain-containing protein [Oribacterium sp. C9]OON84805.1 molybdopterin oxidoreductase [Oribacterium sp. C9]